MSLSAFLFFIFIRRYDRSWGRIWLTHTGEREIRGPIRGWDTSLSCTILNYTILSYAMISPMPSPVLQSLPLLRYLHDILFIYVSPLPLTFPMASNTLCLSSIVSLKSIHPSLSYLTSSWVAAILVPSFFTTPNDSLLSFSKLFYLNSPAIRCSCRWQYHRRERERKGSRTVRQVWKGRGTRRRTGRGTGQLLVLETIS